MLRAYALRGELTGWALTSSISIRGDVRFSTGSQSNVGQRRRAAYQPTRRCRSIGVIRGIHPYVWAADPNRRSDVFVEGSVSEAEVSVRGFPGSAGVVGAPVRVLSDFADGAAFQPGEVLVTTITNVGWTPLFPRAAAVITDVGAPLSHAAIVARELGIPAVVGCGNATMRLRTGDRVRVDGTAGTVEVLM